MKSIGGTWGKMPDSLLEWCENEGNCETWPQMDGVKKICMDHVYKNVKSNSCLVYSFGLSEDWSFEEIMALLGCKVGKVMSYHATQKHELVLICFHLIL